MRKPLTIFPRFEDNYVLYGRELQETKAVVGGTISLQRNKREGTASLVKTTTSIKLQVSVASVSP